MQIYEITHVYGTGPFGRAGATQVYVTGTIKGWLDLAAKGTRRYDPEGILHDLFVMSPLVWRGLRRIAGLPYSSPQTMNRLDRLSSRLNDSQLRLFTGVFPRLKGQPCNQILWWRPLPTRAVLIGVEEDLDSFDQTLDCHDTGTPQPYPHDSWVGFTPVAIDRRPVEPISELVSHGSELPNICGLERGEHRT
jgi:hypothetical protein